MVDLTNIGTILSLLVLVLATQIIITFFHELAHKISLKKRNIKSEIKWNISGIIRSLGYAEMATCIFEEKKFMKLKDKDKKRIILAGFYSDLIFTLIFLILSIASWAFLKGDYLWYYLNLNTLMLLLKLLLNIFSKKGDFEKLKQLT